MAKGLTSNLRDYSTKMVYLLILVEAVSVYFLWTLNPVTQVGEEVFAVFLAVDILSLMMISYIYRTYKSGDQFNRALLTSACALILVLVYASLAI